jgi:hypothetical protein
MNARIKELLLKAGWDGYEALDERNQKFAELLVQECAYIVENSPWRLKRGYKAIDQANLVKQHFGVE